jgi:hypothetical protein
VKRVIICAAAAADTAAVAGAPKRGERAGRAIVHLLAHEAREMLQLPDVNGFAGRGEKHCLA